MRRAGFPTLDLPLGLGLSARQQLLFIRAFSSMAQQAMFDAGFKDQDSAPKGARRAGIPS